MSENNNNINYGIDKLTESFRTIINSYSLTSQMIENMTKPIKIMAERMAEMSKAITNAIMITKINYTPFFDELGKVLQKVKENPDSMFNWIEYSRKLSDYIWTIPYGIDSKQLKEIFEQVNSESEFDAYMRRYYKKTVVQDMIKDIKEMLPKKHEQIFNQIVMAYNNKMYALSIVGMMSIIDELCAYFINDKGTSARMNMFNL